MTVSLSTIFTRTIINSFLLIIVVISLKKLNKNKMFNTGFLFFIITLSIISIALPVEFKYTLAIPSKKIMPFIQDTLHTQLFSFKNLTIEAYMVFFAVWFLGSLVKLISLLRQQLKMRYFIKLFSKYKTTAVIRNRKINILRLPVVDSPSVVGLIHPTIILPDLKMTDEEFDFIIKHEGLHVSNSDLTIKYFYELLLIVYWWNPLGYIFKSMMNQTLEIRVDEGVLNESKSEHEKIEYVETLVNISKQLQADGKRNALSASFAAYDKNLLLNRSKNILDYKENKYANKFGKYLFLPLLIAGFFLISSIVFEPYTAAPTEENGTEIVGTDDVYFIKTDDKYGKRKRFRIY